MNESSYKNPWHKPGHDAPMFTTAAKPAQLGKYTRYQRIPGSYDFVFNGVCFAQRAGPATEEQIDADKFAQTNLLHFCDVKFGPTWDDEEPTNCLECGGVAQAYDLACETCRNQVSS